MLLKKYVVGHIDPIIYYKTNIDARKKIIIKQYYTLPMWHNRWQSMISCIQALASKSKRTLGGGTWEGRGLYGSDGKVYMHNFEQENKVRVIL